MATGTVEIRVQFIYINKTHIYFISSSTTVIAEQKNDS